jgi:hypothetical protein
MKKSTGRYCITIGLFVMVASILATPLFIEWFHSRATTSMIRADYVLGLSRVAGFAGDRNRECRLRFESRKIRQNWLTEVVKCQSQEEVQMLLEPLAIEGVGRGQEQHQNPDGSWELHIIVENQEVLTYALKRISEIRTERNAENAQQVGRGHGEKPPN